MVALVEEPLETRHQQGRVRLAEQVYLDKVMLAALLFLTIPLLLLAEVAAVRVLLVYRGIEFTVVMVARVYVLPLQEQDYFMLVEEARVVMALHKQQV